MEILLTKRCGMEAAVKAAGNFQRWRERNAQAGNGAADAAEGIALEDGRER